MYRSTYTDVLAYALRRTATPHDAEDVVAATYLTAWRRLDDVLDTTVPVAWLYQVAAGHLANQRRGDRRLAAFRHRLFSVPPPPPPDPADAPAAEENRSSVLKALATLPSADQELLRLVAFEELSPAEIAEAWGVPSRLVRVRLHRARRRLQAALERHAEPSTRRRPMKRKPSGGHNEAKGPSDGPSPDQQGRER